MGMAATTSGYSPATAMVMPPPCEPPVTAIWDASTSEWLRAVDGADGIREEAAIVVMLGIEDPFGHAARDMGVAAVGVQIGRVSCRPAAALSARVHDEMSVACAGPQQPVKWEIPPAP